MSSIPSVNDKTVNKILSDSDKEFILIYFWPKFHDSLHRHVFPLIIDELHAVSDRILVLKAEVEENTYLCEIAEVKVVPLIVILSKTRKIITSFNPVTAGTNPATLRDFIESYIRN